MRGFIENDFLVYVSVLFFASCFKRHVHLLTAQVILDSELRSVKSNLYIVSAFFLSSIKTFYLNSVRSCALGLMNYSGYIIFPSFRFVSHL